MAPNMAELYCAASVLLTAVGFSAGSLSPHPQLILATAPTGQPSKRSPSGGYSVEIEELPWSIFARSGEEICNGIIIHKHWVLILRSCEFNTANGSEINVSAGGATPEDVKQVLKAEIHPSPDLLERGVTLLHLKDSLVFSKYVQPARILSGAAGDLNYFYGFTSGFAHEGNNIQLKAFDTTLFTDLCPDSENLCALGLDWPQSEANLAGIDFLGLPDYYENDGTYRYCLMGGRKSQLGNNFTSYYPLLNILPYIQRELGLTVVPTPEESLCGILQ